MAADMFLNIPEVEGESIDANHGGDIEIKEWSYGMGQDASVGDGTGASVGKVLYEDITVTKVADKSSSILSKNCSSGKHFPEMTIFTRKAGGDAPLEYYILHLEHVLITSFQVEADSDGVVNEVINMRCGKFKVDYTPQDESGVAAGGTITFGWDITANTEWS